MLRILSYIILSSILLFAGTLTSAAQTNEPQETIRKEVKAVKKDSVKLWQGILIETDLIPIFQKTVLNSDAYSFLGSAQLNLKNKYYPTIEAGMGGADKTSANGIQFKTTGIFGKIGLDVPVFRPAENSTQKNNVFLAGVRLGMSQLNYSLYNLTLTDEYWGGTETINMESINDTKFWFEVNAGLRVEVFKNIFMGWSVRNRRLINRAKPGETAPWYIPGYGTGTDSGWGFSYTLGYKIK